MIPFSPPRIDQKIIDEVVSVLKSGWISTGARTRQFEADIAVYTGVPSVLCLNSATAGLEIMLRWFGVKEGDEVIVPAYTYAATANVVVHCGATPVFADVNPSDFNISLSEIEKRITGKTKAIMPVDFAGYPCDYEAIAACVSRKDIREKFIPSGPEQKSLGRILILSDSAHSIGAFYKGKRAGSLADVSVFSFHAVKNLTTAEGGAVCLNLPKPFDNKKLYAELCIKSLHGQNKDALAKLQVGSWKYDIVEPGYKCNMTDIQAAIGIVELERYDSDMLVRRKKIFDLYSEAFREFPWAQLPEYRSQNKTSSYHVYALRIKNITEEQRDRIIREIFNRGVSVNVHFIPVPMMSYYSRSGYSISEFPVSYDSYSREISLPVYYSLTDEHVKQVIRSVVESVQTVTGIKSHGKAVV